MLAEGFISPTTHVLFVFRCMRKDSKPEERSSGIKFHKMTEIIAKALAFVNATHYS
jgi:hypothetical protein